MEKYMGDVEGKKVLHLGCNYGPFVYYLRTEGVEAYGLDKSEIAASYPASRGENFMVIGDAKNIPFKEGSLDCVLSTNFVTGDYLDDGSMAIIMGESFRALKEGGIMVLSSCYLGDKYLVEQTGFSEAHHLRRKERDDLILWPDYVLVK
jgi:ubiquinone/menaquinone biosynthesis C-methylase UbiE